MIADLRDINIKELSCTYDPASLESFVSLYLDMQSPDMRFIEKRRKACEAVLKTDRELLANFEKTVGTIVKHVEMTRAGGSGTGEGRQMEKGLRGMAVFASHINGFFRAFHLAVPVENLLVVDASPYIRPLALLMEEYDTSGIVLLDSHRSRLYALSLGKIEDEDKIVEDIMNKHKKGGMSRARFQRLRKGAIDHFLKEVAEDAEKLFSKDEVVNIVLAGPGNIKTMFKDYLSSNLKSKVVGVMDADFDVAEGELVLKAEKMVLKDENEKSEKNVAVLKEEILKDGLAVHGLKDTMGAVRNGEVELLLVNRDYRARGWICEKCQVFEPGTADCSSDKCPYCGGRTSEVDVIEEIIEFAERTDTRIEFLESNPTLELLGNIGGLLRFKT